MLTVISMYVGMFEVYTFFVAITHTTFIARKAWGHLAPLTSSWFCNGPATIISMTPEDIIVVGNLLYEILDGDTKFVGRQLNGHG